MSHIPPNGPPPPYGYGYPSGSHPPPPGSYPGYAYVPAPVMMPMPVYQPQHPAPPQPEPVQPQQPTYVTNYIYQQPPQPEPRVEDPPPPPPPPPVPTVIHRRPGALFPGLREQLAITLSKVDESITNILTSREIIDWACATPHSALTLTHKAFVGGKEGWDDSPLWIIRAHHSGEFVPGKFVVKTRTAYIPHGGKEIPVHNFEILLAHQHTLRWLPSSHGQVPAGAIPAGNTHSGEPLYIARARHLRSTTPGKVHPSHGCCYIPYGGAEIPYKNYEVLCRIVG